MSVSASMDPMEIDDNIFKNKNSSMYSLIPRGETEPEPPGSWLAQKYFDSNYHFAYL